MFKMISNAPNVLMEHLKRQEGEAQSYNERLKTRGPHVCLGQTNEEACKTRQNKGEKQKRVSSRNRLLIMMEQWRVWTNTNNRFN